MSKRKTYSREYKIGAIQMIEQKGMTTREASEALGINEGMLGRWRKEYKEGKLQAFPGNGRMSDKDAEIARFTPGKPQVVGGARDFKKSDGIVRSTNVRRYQFILEYQRVWPTRLMCSALNVSTSGYYRWKSRKPSRSSLRRHILAIKIREIHVQFKKVYGYRRVYKSLHKEGLRVGQNAVLRIMRHEGIKPWYVRKHRKYREIQPECLAAPNRIKQRFKVGKPNCAWLTDITEVNTPDGKLYVAIVEDLGSRKVVGHAMGTRMTSMLPLSALRKALMERGIPKALICHSDQGSQYRSKQYRKELAKHGIRPSMSRRGNCYDNTPAESFFAIMKRELDLRSMHTREQTAQEIFEFIECFYNRKRIHSALGYISPEEHELHWKTKYSSRIRKKHISNLA